MGNKTQTELMNGTGIDRSDISGYWNGQKPDFLNLFRFCFALDISPTWLVFGRGRQVLSHIPNDPDDPARELMVAEIEREIKRYAERLALAAKSKKLVSEGKKRNKAAAASSVSKSRTEGDQRKDR